MTGQNRTTCRKYCTSVTMSTTKPTWTDLESNAGLRGKRLVVNRQSHSQGSCRLELLTSNAHHSGIPENSSLKERSAVSQRDQDRRF
jgi:hypothetical protein